MLFLLFYLSDEMYAIKCENVKEVAPMVNLKESPHMPPFFAGLFNYRNSIVPVIDLCKLIQGTYCRKRLSTRIVIVEYTRENKTPFIMGFMAERVVETIRRPSESFIGNHIQNNDSPYLGGIIMDQDKMINYIDLDALPKGLNFLPISDNSSKALLEGLTLEDSEPEATNNFESLEIMMKYTKDSKVLDQEDQFLINHE